MAGLEHAARAIDTAQGLLRITGHGSPEGPWVPIGAGVHTGTAFVGVIASDSATDFTALGDPVNIAAHLASQAEVGEALVTHDSADAAGVAKAYQDILVNPRNRLYNARFKQTVDTLNAWRTSQRPRLPPMTPADLPAWKVHQRIGGRFNHNEVAGAIRALMATGAIIEVGKTKRGEPIYGLRGRHREA